MTHSAARPPFFEVSCCPTNLVRTFASLGAYLATQDDDGVQLHQYAPATIRTTLPTGALELRVTTRYPDEGRIEVQAVTAPEGPWALTLRVPAWAQGATVRTADGGEQAAEPGYITLPGPAAGESVVLDLPLAPRFTWADPRIDAVRGQVAVERGPVVMALESIDLGADVATARVLTTTPPAEVDGQVRVQVRTVALDDRDWPYPSAPADGQAQPGTKEVPLIPYHSWAERGPCTMRVWIPETD